MRHKGMWKGRIAFLAGATSVAVIVGVAAQALVMRSAPVNKFSGVDEVVEACTQSTSFVNMPQMTRMFTQGGSVNDEIAAMFSGGMRLDTSGGAFDTGFIRFTVDGTQQSPGEIPAVAAGTPTGTVSFNWQSMPVAPGTHTARVQWRTDLGGELCVDARSLIVWHK